MNEFRLLTADEIECRVKKVTEKGAIILLYKTARVDMDLLDEVYGAANWECDYKEIKGNLYCGIGIRTESGIVWKWDCGVESREDDDGNQKKGEASDSFKRAGFKCGIGRELYTSPFVFIGASKMNINGNKTFDTFSVADVKYDSKRRIAALHILNEKTHEICYSWQSGQPQIEPPPPEPKNLPPVVGKVDLKAESKLDPSNLMQICEKCKKAILPFKGEHGTISPARIVKSSQEKFGKTLCADCAIVEGGEHAT